MPDSLSIEQALRRLASALDRLESNLDQRVEDATAASGFAGELHQLGADRSRLAQALDAAEARYARLEDANAQASRGLVQAMESIRDVLARNGA